MGFLKHSIVFAVSLLVCCDADGNATNGTNGTATDGDSSASVSCTRADDEMWRNMDDKTVQADSDSKQLLLCLAAEFVHAAQEKGINVSSTDFKRILIECGGPDLTDVQLDTLDLTTEKPSMPESATVDLGDVKFEGFDVGRCIEAVESLEDDQYAYDAAVQSRLAIGFGVALSFIFLS